jgi:hypothetical protein
MDVNQQLIARNKRYSAPFRLFARTRAGELRAILALLSERQNFAEYRLFWATIGLLSSIHRSRSEATTIDTAV